MKGDSTTYLNSMISKGENLHLDFKFEISDARKIARTFSAFSNTEGGRLLVGVKDNGRISGVRSDEEYYMAESAALIYCKPEIRFETTRHQVEGKHVLEIYIPPVSEKPVFARDERNRWMAYVRVDDENMLASIIQLNIWEGDRGEKGNLLEYTRKEQILLDNIQQKGQVTLKEIQADTGFQRKDLVGLITKLVSFDVLTISYSGGRALFSINEHPG